MLMTDSSGSKVFRNFRGFHNGVELDEESFFPLQRYRFFDYLLGKQK